MKRSEINSKLIQIRAELARLSNRLEKVKGVDLSKVIEEMDKAGTHITAAIRELKET